MRMDELVHMDLHGEFRSDVQLSDYEDRDLNRELLRKYIFTVHAPTTFGAAQRDYAAKDVLDLLKSALTAEHFDNRIVLSANYGRGKSHLDLVLANFFARESDSDELKIIFGRLNQALNNPAQLNIYREFKQSKGEFFVVRLQGDRFEDLQEGFLFAIEQALKDHDATHQIKLPFWFSQAESWLNSLDSVSRSKAEAFLAERNTDLPSLVADLRKQGSYDLVREVAKHINGFYPDFGRDISLEDLVIWIVDDVCIPNKLGGLVVLFDEFSLFLQKYAAGRVVGKLQELLNGISKRQSKSVFLAFSQVDVETVAETYAQGQRREDIKKELERLPKDKRGRLFSLMESVLDAYLRQDETAWRNWSEKPSIKPKLARAREIVYEHFGKHYSNELQWNPEAYSSKVIKGCFPLHPLTTAILSVHNFEAGTSENPRTALQFVRHAWDKLSLQPAELPDGSPNFIFPIELVNFFGEQINKKWYAAYRNTLDSFPQQITESQQKVLQGLLLQHSVGLKAKAGGQIELLFHLTGLSNEEIKTSLKKLAEHKIIQSDPINKTSSLWPFITRPQDVENIIEDAIKRIPIDNKLMAGITSTLPPFDLIGVARSFGHTDDWAPHQVALTADMLSVSALNNLSQPFRVEQNNIFESPRGLIVWLIAQNDNEQKHLRQVGQKWLDEALESISHPIPVVIVLPKRPMPHLIQAVRKSVAIQQLTTSEREKIGSMIIDQEKAFASQSLKVAIDEFTGGQERYADIRRELVEYALPAPYRASVQTLAEHSLKAVVSECYRQAYAYRVKFFTQYPLGGKTPNQLRKAVKRVSMGLFSNGIAGILDSLGNRDIHYQIITEYLQEQWGLLSHNTREIKTPTSRSLLEAWNHLETVFAAGCNEVRVASALQELMNPPYGHDYNTLILLLAAWVGYHRFELRLSLGGRVIDINEFKNFFDQYNNFSDFMYQICIRNPLTLSRYKPDEMFDDVKTILEKIRHETPFTTPEAQEAITILVQATTNPLLPLYYKEEIQQSLPRLQQALEQANEYDQNVSAWLAEFQKAEFENLFNLNTALRKLIPHRLVSPNQPVPEELKKRWENRLNDELQIFCDRYAGLDDLSDFKSHEAKLQNVRSQLKEYPLLIEVVNQSLKQLNQNRDELRKIDSEKELIAEINSMTPTAGLATLYQYKKRLTELNNLSAPTEKKCKKKLEDIESRIRQFEQLSVELPSAAIRASSLIDLQKIKELLLRNLEQVNETAVYQIFTELQQKISHLESFFEVLKTLESFPRDTPANLDILNDKFSELEEQFSPWINPPQRELLAKKKEEIETIRQKLSSEAQHWWENILERYKSNENPETLLKDLESPPAFLSPENCSKCDQLRQIVQKMLNNDLILQIEALFLRLDTNDRKGCLQRLYKYLEKS